MRLGSLRFALLFLITAACLSPVAAQNYALPAELKLDRATRLAFPVYFGRDIYNRASPESFYPIGWSRDGKFAYYVEPVDEACGCYFAELVIQDLRTDKVLYHFKNDPQSRLDDKGEIIADDMRRLWTRNRTVFNQKLSEHGIVAQGRFVMLARSFTIAGRSNYTATLGVTRGSDSDGNRRVRKMNLELSSPRLGRKSLFSSEWNGDDLYVAPLDAAVAGVFKSPYENRIAVLTLKVQRGYEGPPHTVQVQINGGDLNGGFKR